MTQYRAALEEQSRHTLTVVPKKTIAELLALVETQANVAMASTALEAGEIQLVKIHRDAPLGKVRAFEVARTRIAVAAHPDNPAVRRLAVLTGQ